MLSSNLAQIGIHEQQIYDLAESLLPVAIEHHRSVVNSHGAIRSEAIECGHISRKEEVPVEVRMI